MAVADGMKMVTASGDVEALGRLACSAGSGQSTLFEAELLIS